MKYNRYNKPVNQIIYLNESEDFIDEMDDRDFDDDLNEEDDQDFDDDLNEDADYINEAEDDNQPDPPMDEEKLRIESVKLATNIAKLMSNVMPEDIINLAGHVAAFIRNNNNQDLSASTPDFGGTDDTEFEDMPEDEESEE